MTDVYKIFPDTNIYVNDYYHIFLGRNVYQVL